MAATSQAHEIRNRTCFIEHCDCRRMNWYVRHWQYQVWSQNPQVFYLDDGTPLFTTTDAPYFLSISKELKKGGGYIDFREKRYYPNLIEKDATQNTSLQNFLAAPLLSAVVSWLSEDSPLQKNCCVLPINYCPYSQFLVF